MEQMVRVKSRVGPHHITRRYWNERGYVKEQYDWNFDNSFVTQLPRSYWESLENEYLDRQANLRYKEAFILI